MGADQRSDTFTRAWPGYQKPNGAQPMPVLINRPPGGIAMAEMMIQSPDEVVAFLKAQHNLIEDMFDEVLLASDPEAREKPFVHLRQLLAVHETAEEMVIHPRVRREGDAIDSIVDARLEEGHEAKELLWG